MSDSVHPLSNSTDLQSQLHDHMDRIIHHIQTGDVLAPQFRWHNQVKNVLERARDIHNNHPNMEQKENALKPLVSEYNDLTRKNPDNSLPHTLNRAQEGGRIDPRLELHHQAVVIPGNYSYITNR